MASNLKLTVIDSPEARWVQSQIEWAQGILDRAQAGERFDHLPVGHDVFMERVQVELDKFRDELIEHYGLVVTA